MVLVGVGILAMVSCTVVANLLMKRGAVAAEADRIFSIVSPITLLGIGMFAVAAIIYSWLLHHLPLNVAQAFASVQFIAVIAAAAVVLGEPIPSLRWVGIMLIAAGILLVALTYSDRPLTL
jgi:undecaprenyl phosphate-alpha-L-ara4N flippase subunit ArnE